VGATELSELRIAKIALVKRPANQRPLLLLKSEETMPDPKKTDLTLAVAESMIPILKGIVEPVANEDALVAGVVKLAKAMDEEQTNKVRMALRLLAGLPGLPEDAMKALAAAAGIEMAAPDAAAMTKEKHEAAVAEAVTKAVAEALAKAKAPAARIIKTADGVEIDLSKIPEDQRAPFEAIVKHADAQTAKLTKEVSERTRRDLVEKSKTDYPHLDATKIATVLQKSADREDASKELTEVLKQAEALAAHGGTGELGSGAAGTGGDAWGKIEAGGRSIVAKSADMKLTPEQGVDRFMQTPEGRALYAEHRKEASAQ